MKKILTTAPDVIWEPNVEVEKYKADEIDQLRKQNDELITVLERIASLRNISPFIASIAQSALDTMKALK